MNRNIVLGAILVLLGVFALTYERIPYKRTQEKSVDVGPLFQERVEKEKSLPVPLVFGALVIVVGAILVFQSRK